MLTHDQEKLMLHFLERLRDKLAADIVHNGLRDAREFRAVCALLNDVRPAIRAPQVPALDSPPQVH